MTILDNRELETDLNYEDFQDFHDAAAGFARKLEESIGKPPAYIWDIHRYDSLLGEPLFPQHKDDDAERKAEFEDRIRDRIALCPATVSKSLWRQALLNHMHGLFRVREGVWQVRGYDLANLTIVEVSDGEAAAAPEGGRQIVVIDCTTDRETAAAALGLYEKERGAYRIAAVIFTHSHVDHYGGIGGVLGERIAEIPILAPEHFLEEAALENALVGDAMARCSTYQYGTLLDVETAVSGREAAGKDGEPDALRLADGKVDAGLGKDIQRGGTVGFATPDISVVPNPDGLANEHGIDDVTVLYEEALTKIGDLHFEFLLCPGTEAPAEMTVWIEEYHTLVAAEIATHTLHNLLTPRGAAVRDARLWWKALDRLICRYGERMDCICATHHWSMADTEAVPGRIVTFLEQQRDSYKFLHDQSVRLMNRGYTMPEIADWFGQPEHLPDFMRKQWHNRGYYGTVSHDVRAIYQKYLGWYDMNPSNLNPLPPEEAAGRYIEAIGEENAYNILRDTLRHPIDNEDREKDYRFAAEIGRHLVLSGCGAKKPWRNRIALAAVYRALAGCCEAGTWRNMYLAGARELEEGGPLGKPAETAVSQDILNAMDEEMFYDYIATRWNAERALQPWKCEASDVPEEADSAPWEQKFYIVETDIGAMELTVANGVLNYRPYSGPIPGPDGVSFETDREDFSKLVTGRETLTWENNVKTFADWLIDIRHFFDLFDHTKPDFEIVLPKE